MLTGESVRSPQVASLEEKERADLRPLCMSYAAAVTRRAHDCVACPSLQEGPPHLFRRRPTCWPRPSGKRPCGLSCRRSSPARSTPPTSRALDLAQLCYNRGLPGPRRCSGPRRSGPSRSRPTTRRPNAATEGLPRPLGLGRRDAGQDPSEHVAVRLVVTGRGSRWPPPPGRAGHCGLVLVRSWGLPAGMVRRYVVPDWSYARHTLGDDPV